MADSNSTDGSILIASDNAGDSTLIRGVLSDFPDGSVVATTDSVAEGGHAPSPDVLILAFHQVAQSEQFLRDFQPANDTDAAKQLRTVVLCDTEEVKHAQSLCTAGTFDDYVLFWPLTNDSARLSMSVRLLLRTLAVEQPASPSVGDFAASARRLANMEPMVEGQLTEGRQHLQAARTSVSEAEVRMDAAFDALAVRLASGELSDIVEVKDAAKLEQALARMKAERIMQPLKAIDESMQPLTRWAKGFSQRMQPHIAAARSLGEMAQKVAPLVLVVDDDSMQRSLVRNILTDERYRVALVASGREALNAIGRLQPSLVLMDLVMPEMDGLETVTQIKALPAYAKLPIIMVTLKSYGNIVRDCLKAGVVDFIVKPVRPVALLARVALAAGETLGCA